MTASPLRTPQRLMHSTAVCLGLEQVSDVPTSTDRTPRGMHRGPGKRQTSAKEMEQYQFVQRWSLEMQGSWDTLEPFKGLPKPKAQFGNEAAEVIWPYALLLESVIKVHPFTKSIYLYYGQRQDTDAGRRAARAARTFAQTYMIPITFHNSQVYVETEMLLEYNEVPWFVVCCLDGRQTLLPIKVEEGVSESAAAEGVLAAVVEASSALGEAVTNPRELTRALNARPLQNQYLRINYQWYGDSPDERMAHLVRWSFDPEDVEPVLRSRSRHVVNWLNYDSKLPTHNAVRVNVRREARRLRAPKADGSPRTFYNSANARANAKTSRFSGPPPAL